MALTIPPNNRAVGTPDPPGDMNNVSDMLGLLTQTLATAGGTNTSVNTTAVTAVQALKTAQVMNFEQVSQAQRITTTSDLTTQVLAVSTPPAFAPILATSPRDVMIDPAEQFQLYAGAGAALTDSACYVLQNYMSPAQRATLLNYLFSPAATSAGWSMIRICIGPQSFQNAAAFTTYDDMPGGQTDPGMASFSVLKSGSAGGGAGGDGTYIIPVLQQIMAINPGVRIIASLWSTPAWMLSSGTVGTSGEVLNTANYAALAQYFVSFIQAYQNYGIPIWAVSPFNEPVAQTYMNISQATEIAFIAVLGPALIAAGLGNVKILCLDDNWATGTARPAAIMAGTAASGPYTSGVAWHAYGGSPTVMSQMQALVPSAIQIQTEWRSLANETLTNMMQGHAGGYIAGGAQNNAAGFVLWNLALDQNGAPNQGVGGRIGAVTVNNGTGAVTYNTGFYALTHLTQYIQPGARRCLSNTFGLPYASYSVYPSDITTAAWINPDGSVVLYAFNGAPSSQTFNIIDRRTGTGFPVTMVAGELSTFVWGNTRQAVPAAAAASPAVPAAPVLTATGGPGEVALSWTVPSSASPVTWYVIGRSTTTNTEVTRTEVPAAVTTWTDITGAAGTWFYTVTAVSAAGAGTASTEKSATATAVAAPAAPVLTATPVGTRIVLSWPPVAPNGAVITSYDIRRSTTTGTEVSIATATQGSSSYADTTPVLGTPYFYKITAVNSAGTSPLSNEVTATTAGTVVDATATAAVAGNTGSMSWTHTVGAAASPVLLVAVGYNAAASGNTVSLVSYGGANMTRLMSQVPSPGGGTDKSVDVWYLLNPPAGANTVAVTFAGTHANVACSVSLTGVAAAPLRTPIGFASTSSNAPTASTTGGAASDLVLAFLHERGSNAITPGGGQTAIVTTTGSGAPADQLIVTKQAGGTGTVVSSFSWTTADMCSEIAVAVAAL